MRACVMEALSPAAIDIETRGAREGAHPHPQSRVCLAHVESERQTNTTTTARRAHKDKDTAHQNPLPPFAPLATMHLPPFVNGDDTLSSARASDPCEGLLGCRNGGLLNR